MSERPRRRWWPWAAAHAPLAFALIVTLPFWPPNYPGDHFTFWAAGHIVASGRSPYDASAWTEPAIDAAAASGLAVDMRPIIAQCCAVLWAYPPWTAVALAPFGALPFFVGIPLLHFTSWVAAVLAAVALARSLPWRDLRTYALALLMFALSEPLIAGIRGGHFDGVLLGGVYLVQLGLRGKRPWPMAVGAVLLSLKPHAVLVLPAVVLALLIAHKRWSQIAWTAATLGVIAMFSLVAYPDSLAAIAAGSAERAAVQGATTWTLVASLRGGPSTILVTTLQLAIALACALSVWLAPRSLRVQALVAAALVAGLAFVPYAQDHDQLLLIPAVTLAVFYGDLAPRGGGSYLVSVTIAFLGLPWLFVVLPAIFGSFPTLAGSVPYFAAISLLGGAWLVRITPAAASSSPRRRESSR